MIKVIEVSKKWIALRVLIILLAGGFITYYYLTNKDAITFKKEFESYSTYYSYYFEITFDGSGKVNIGNLSLVDITPRELVIQGDVNDDGQYDLSDFVLFQKWLLGSSTARLDNWEAADLCKDNRLDVFDLCLMRRRLIG